MLYCHSVKQVIVDFTGGLLYPPPPLAEVASQLDHMRKPDYLPDATCSGRRPT